MSFAHLLHPPRKSALLALREVILTQWEWKNVWASFSHLTHAQQHLEEFAEIEIEDVVDFATPTKQAFSPQEQSGNVSTKSSIHIDFNFKQMAFKRLLSKHKRSFANSLTADTSSFVSLQSSTDEPLIMFRNLDVNRPFMPSF